MECLFCKKDFERLVDHMESGECEAPKSDDKMDVDVVAEIASVFDPASDSENV
jgi:hypothetical protein